MAYAELVDISFMHTYFINNVFESLTFKPSSSTELLLLNHGLVYRIYPGGFRIFYDTNFNNKERNREELFSDKIDCRFNVSLTDSSFYNYTSMEVTDIRKKVFHFYNTDEKSGQLKNMIQSGEYVSEIDLKPISEINEPDFKKPFAIIDLRLSLGLPDSYIINFKAKETIWRYILMGEHLQSLIKPAIIDNNGNETFEGPDLLIFNGNKGLAFKSKSFIRFSQRSLHNFQLVENYDSETGRYKVVIRALPQANPDMITLIKGDNKLENKNYSEIFIN